ncbi:hypothetical protein CAEBREN_22499 [Caenorhabditis brenneri]|uniref:RING-type domain-containing protein n=1 Tax=Caenorhabditis brenneri TaxID=135651 RepID=G0M7E2_CAEBE|nr:hypothetical protein CAEBREN_22499 [Caenorhabditis brenneri]
MLAISTIFQTSPYYSRLFTYSRPKCSVCDNGFGEGDQRPIVFPCGHSYCFNCAKELLKLPPANIMTCPFCRKRFRCTDETEFVTNFAIATAVREQREIDLSSSTTLVEDPEVPCAEHKNHEATIHCKNCRADYCDMCFNKFHSSKVLSEHDTLPIEQKPTILPMCEVHKETEGMYYCLMPECGFTFCSLCKDKHEGHQYLEVNGIITENVETMENFVQNSHLLKEKYQEEIEAKEEEIRNLPQKIEQLKITLNFDMIRNWNIAYQQIDDFAQTHKDQLMGAKKHYSDCLQGVETCNAMTLRILKRKTGLFDAEDTLGHIAKAKRFKMAQPVYQIPLVQCGAVTADFGLGPMPWPPNCSLPVQPMPLAQNCSLPVQPMPLAQNHTFPIEPVPQAQNYILPVQPMPQAQNHILPIEPMPLAQNHTLPMEPIPQAQNYILPAQPMPQAQNHILPIEAIAKAMFSMFNVWALPPAPAS